MDENRAKTEAVGKKVATYRAWQGNLPLTVGTKDGRAIATQDLPRTVGLTLPSAAGSAGKGSSNPFQTRYLPIAFLVNLIIAILDYSQGCLEFKKEKQSRTAD
ncbi:hypothetical protein M9H77_17337 [Catharanthus roseus]|uniref:Uncharacterized protein n=1 Tax=Catharanthus roseus TaxID=4058 RepID=A0ACC0B4B3_CATRO|nr:hypothetical protein M9H77_17337 [Catharanthus roseus]